MYTTNIKSLLYKSQIQEDLETTSKYADVKKDILIVTHNQFQFLKDCINSIRKNTENYQIYIWDNASVGEMKEWIESQSDCRVYRSEENLGFIIPNNELAKKSDSPYIILLNDDTIVKKNWDKALISHLQVKNYSQVGYSGGWLDNSAKGKVGGFGEEIDYVVGWCFAISRETYQKIGLFDDNNLKFAYGEDSDFSLRIKANDGKIYALHLDLVHHFGNSTIISLGANEDRKNSFYQNHKYLLEKWK